MRQIPGLKDMEVTTLLAIFLFPGAGHIYLSEIGRGITFILGYMCTAIVSVFVFFIFPPVVVAPLAIWIWQIFDARKGCREHNEDIMRAYYQPHGQPVAVYRQYPGAKR